ncbi:MAG: hypothetical protein HGA19_16265, partial [Oscillochloris sp.]|nr:hypothetical protein [Oscillochloris sp.]
HGGGVGLVGPADEQLGHLLRQGRDAQVAVGDLHAIRGAEDLVLVTGGGVGQLVGLRDLQELGEGQGGGEVQRDDAEVTRQVILDFDRQRGARRWDSATFGAAGR